MDSPAKTRTASDDMADKARGIDPDPACRYPKATRRAAAEGKQTSNPSDRLREPPADVMASQPAKAKDASPRLKHIGGSNDDTFNIALARATGDTDWIVDRAAMDRSIMFIGKALAGIGPKDELEGMLAAQMVAMHLASMECSRRAMISNQSSDCRSMNLKAAARASQTYAALLGALDKHRGKGRQTVRVEHIHIAPGAQAIVGNVEAGRGRDEGKNGEQSDAPRLAHAPAPFAPMWSEDPSGEPLPVTGDGERALPDARRHEPRRASR